jgi:hypothetical protein
MKAWVLMLPDLVRWNIRSGDPATFPITAAGDVSLVNPLAAPLVFSTARADVFRLDDDLLHVLGNQLIFLLGDERERDQVEEATSWLRLLRLVGKQASLPTSPIAYAEREIDEKELNVKWPADFRKGEIFGEYRVATALKAAAIANARSIGVEANVPLCDELLLDAILALEDRRYREAILFCAIAIESLAKDQLTRIYEQALMAKEPVSHLNIVESTQAGGQTTKRDPIFAILVDGDNFGRLLHEAPLYVLRRSLLVDQPALYQHARELYGTRNRLGHGQQITEQAQKEQNLLGVDAKGGKKAVQTAIDVFQWFGRSGFQLPDHSTKVKFG